MIEGKEGISRKNLIEFAFVCTLAVSLIFMVNFVISYSTVYGGNNTWTTNVVNYTNISWPGNIVNEDWSHVYNISVNNSDAGGDWNITSVNVSLPSNFVYTLNLYTVTSGSNGSGNFSATEAGVAALGTAFFSNTTDASGVTTLSWNMSGATGALLWGNSSQTMFFWFNATATDPGKYNISVKVTYNQTTGTPVGVYNQTNVTIWVNDTTAPENVTFSGIYGLNKSIAAIAHSVGNYSGDLLLNVSTADNSDEVKSVWFNISYSGNKSTNGTRWMFQASNTTGAPNYWFYSLDTGKLPDGTYNVTVLVNDSNGNLNNTRSINITIDNTPPTGTMACTPTEDIYIGQTISCVCSASDAFTGLTDAGESYTASPSSDNAGTFTQTCTFYDRAGNNATASDSYTIWGSPSSGTTSGVSSKPVTKVTSIEEITTTSPATISGFASDSGVKEIAIEVSSTASNVKVTVKKYETKPTNVLSSKAGSYKYLNIETKNLADKLSKATMKIQVEKSWVTARAITKDDVALFRYDENENVWNELTTTYDSDDDTYYYYTIELSSFSSFVIAPKEGVEFEEEEIPTEGEGLSTWVWIIIGIVVVGIIIGGGVALKKRK